MKNTIEKKAKIWKENHYEQIVEISVEGEELTRNRESTSTSKIINVKTI